MPVTGGVSGWLWGGIGLGLATLTLALVRRYGRPRHPDPKQGPD
jgi:hypothetical protein